MLSHILMSRARPPIVAQLFPNTVANDVLKSWAMDFKSILITQLYQTVLSAVFGKSWGLLGVCGRAGEADPLGNARPSKVIVWMVLFDDHLAIFSLPADISISSRFHPDHRPISTKHLQNKCPERVWLWIQMQFHDRTLSSEILVRSDPDNSPRTLPNYHKTLPRAVFGRVGL